MLRFSNDQKEHNSLFQHDSKLNATMKFVAPMTSQKSSSGKTVILFKLNPNLGVEAGVILSSIPNPLWFPELIQKWLLQYLVSFY